MVNAQVLPFACLAAKPGSPVKCARQRWHGGDHRGDNQYGLLEWSDPPAPPPQPEEVMAFGDRHPPKPGPDYVAPVMAVDSLDEQAETWAGYAGAGEREVRRERELAALHATASRTLRALCALVVIAAALCVPAVVIVVYRAAL